MALLLDLTPLRRSPPFRRLYAGFTLSGVGSQLATVAIGLQVYDLTGSTAAVGLVGLFALVPLVVAGLYGGALVDQYDRRTVALVASVVLWATSIGNALQAICAAARGWALDGGPARAHPLGRQPAGVGALPARRALQRRIRRGQPRAGGDLPAAAAA